MEWHRRQAQDQNGVFSEPTENVFSIRPPDTGSAKSEGSVALELVYQASEVINGIQDRANEMEARAKNLARDAMVKLQYSENRIRSLETERLAWEAAVNDADTRINEATFRLHETEKALQRTETRMTAAEVQLKAAELRASEAERALVRIADAIRTQLLGERRASGNLTAAA